MPSWYCSQRLDIASAQPVQESTGSVRSTRWNPPLLASPPRGRYHLGLMSHDVTQLLNALEQGDPHAASRLLPLVYDELRKLSAQRMMQ